MPTKRTTPRVTKATRERWRIQEIIYTTIRYWQDGIIRPNGTAVGRLDQHHTALLDALVERLTKK